MKPINMVLFCPACGTQHIDSPEFNNFKDEAWSNPSHRSHLCDACKHIWRPADVPTNGVAAIQTRGQNDSEPITSKLVQRYLQRRICTMNCGPHKDDPRSAAERQATCDDCLVETKDTFVYQVRLRDTHAWTEVDRADYQLLLDNSGWQVRVLRPV